MKLGVLAVAAAMAAGVALAGGRGQDEKGEYWQSDDGVKHYFLYQGTFTGTRWSINGNSYTRKGAQDGTGTVNWVNDSIFTLEKDTSYSGAYNFGGTPIIYGILHEAPASVRFEGANLVKLGAFGISATSNNKKFSFYASKADPILTASQTWTGPEATELSATPFVVNMPYTYQDSYRAAVGVACDDLVWTLAGDMVLSMKTYTNDLSTTDVVIRKPAILSLPSCSWGHGRLKARTLTIDGGAGIYFGKNTEVALTGIGNGGFDAYGIGSYALLSPEQVAQVIYLKNGATLTAKETTTVTGGVKIVVPPGETAALKGTFSLADDLTEINLGEGAFLDVSEVTVTGAGILTVTGTGTYGPASALAGTDSTGDWLRDSSFKRHYFLYQDKSTAKRWWMGDNSYTRQGAQEGTGSVNWVADSIFTLEKDTAYQGAWSFGTVTTVHGFLHEAPVSVTFEGGHVLSLGSYGIRGTTNNKRFSFYATNMNPILTESQTWTGPDATELSATPFVINMPYTYQSQYLNAVVGTSRDNLVWTLAGDLVLSMKTATNDLSTTDVVIKKPAILSLPHCTDCSWGYGRLKARTLTIDGGAGIYFGKNTEVALTGVGNGGFAAYGIGSYALLTPDQVAPVINLRDDATLTAKETTTVSGGVTVVACAGATAAVVGTFNLADDRTVFRVEAGATLDLSGATFTGRGAYAIVGPGAVTLDGEANRVADATFDGVALVLAGEACPSADFAGVTSLSVRSSSARLFLPDAALSTFGGTEVAVSAGTLLLESARSVPQGRLVVTSGEGALALCDGTGFDAATQMGGTKNYTDDWSDPLVVTDKPVTGTLTVPANATLQILGSGLGAGAALELGAGATVKFYRTATVGADITSTASANFTTVGGGITGTLAGTYVASSVSGASGSGDIWIGTEPGDRLVIDGDWTISDNGGISFYVAKGEVEVHSTVTCKTSVNFRGGHIKVCDGGEWLLNCKWGAYILNSSLMTEPCCFEAGTNGLIKILSGNTEMRVGGNYPAKLLVSGGTYYHIYDGLLLYNNGTIEVVDGTFDTGRRITCNGTAEKSKLVLRGGVYNGRAGNEQNIIFDGTGTCTVLIDGKATVSMPNHVNIPDSRSTNAIWTCTPGSILKYVGRSDKVGTLTLHGFQADGLAFDINTRKAIIQIDGLPSSVELGWCLPGAAGAKIVTTNENIVLNPSYVVPAGQTFDAGNPPTGWYEGFVEGTLQSLTFEEGSTFLFPYFGSGAALALGGKLTLPSAANYRVDAQGPKTKVENATILTAADGIDGDCTWTCVGGISRKRTQLVAEGDSLLFSYDPLGALLLIR